MFLYLQIALFFRLEVLCHNFDFSTSSVAYIERLWVAHIGRLRVAHIGRLRVAHIGRLRVAHIGRLWVAHTMRQRMAQYNPVNDTCPPIRT
jgi:hypothetical protein